MGIDQVQTPGDDDPMAVADQEPVNPSVEGHNTAPEFKDLETDLFLSQVIKRDALNRYQDALAGGDTEGAKNMVYGPERRTVGHEIEQLRIRDLMGDPRHMTDEGQSEQRKIVEEALTLYSEAIRSYENAAESITGGNPDLREKMDEFSASVSKLYDYLEGCIPPSVVKEYIEKSIKENEDFLQGRPDDPAGPRVQRFLTDLKKAAVRNELESGQSGIG